ncbi:rifin, partial [Plasmodium reichenowi]
AHNNNNPSITQKIPTSRLLCECELYAPSNYDSDPQMKRVMQQFVDRSSQRFKECDDRMVEKRKQCKEQCDKEMQKIILKDKLEKQMVEQLTTLDTNITTGDIPTCISEKSMADKVEKGCLRCGQILVAAMPEIGSIGGSLLSALYAWKPTALKIAIEKAIAAGSAQGAVAGKAAGMNVVIKFLKDWGIEQYCHGIYESILKIDRFNNLKNFAELIITKHGEICAISTTEDASKEAMCIDFGRKLGTHLKNGKPYGPPANDLVPRLLEELGGKAETTLNIQAGEVAAAKTATLKAAQEKAIETTFMGNQTAIIASVIAIVVIILVMVIIYLILRYRRKKKMKKKLQYIKLLEEYI